MYDGRFRVYEATLSPSAIVANTSAEQTFTVGGVRAGDVLLAAQKPTAQAGLAIVGYRVSAADEVGITFGNFTGSSITPTASELYLFVTSTPNPIA